MRNVKYALNSTKFFETGNITSDISTETEDLLINCKDLDVSDVNFDCNKNRLSFFHQNIVTLEGNKDELENLLASMNFSFDIVGLTETRIKKNSRLNYNLDLPEYKHFYTSTEMECGGTILYIKKMI